MDISQISSHARRRLLEQDWQRYFDGGRLSRGKQLFKSRAVRHIETELISVGDYHFDFTVQGSYRYNVVIVLTEDFEFSADCSCPDSNTCKHIAASFYWLDELARKPVDHSAKTKIPDKIATESSIEDWVKNLGDSLNDVRGSDHPSDEEYFEAKYKDRVVYILRKGTYHQDGDQLVAKKAKILKGGVLSLQHTGITTNLSYYSKPKYMSPLDYEILMEMSNVDHYGAYLLNSSSLFFASVVEKCGLTNRLCVQMDSSQDRLSPFVFTAPRSLRPNWEANAEGLLKPSVKITPPISRFIKSKPRVFIDHENNEVGVIEQTHSDGFIRNWLNGPTLRADELERVEGLIKNIQPPAEKEKVPKPVVPSPPKQKTLKDAEPRPLLSIERYDLSPAGSLFINGLFLDVVVGKISFFYDEYLVPADSDSEQFSIEKDNVITTIKRDLKAEKKWIKKITDLKLATAEAIFSDKVNSKHTRSYLFSQDKSVNVTQWLGFLAAYEEPLKEQGWKVESIGDLGYTIQEFDDYYEEVNESESDNDWFKFDLGIELDGKKISLIPAIAAAISSGMYKDYDFPDAADARIPIPLEENLFVNFPAARFKQILEKIQDLFQHINADGEIEIPRLRAATLVDDLDLAKSNKTLKDLAELGKNLKNIDGLPKVRVPKNLKAELRDYQVTGYQWLQFLAKYKLNGVLADDMGLGKTIQALTHILAEKNSKTKNPEKLPTLVIAPTSVIPNWCSEAEKFTPSLKVLLYHGSERENLFAQIPKHDIVVTSYALLQRDADLHIKQPSHIVVLDESQYIKNAATKTTKTANKLNANQRICLSGTPMENHLGELWSTFNFLMPGLLQSHKSFNANFRKPIEKDGDTAVQMSLSRRVSPLIMRRTKDLVAKELPAKTIIPHYITLNEQQVDLYETVRASMDKRVRDAISQQGFNKSHILILDALLKLRQICCHPQLLKTAAAKKVKSSGKLDYLTELLQTLIEEKRNILIFSQFTSMLSLIEKHLVKSNIPFVKITGATKDRQTPVKQFQTGEIPVFLISLKAGGTGLNLTAADTVIHYDPWWNPAVENQATDRAHRIGQKKPVFVHKLICRGTIEEQIQLLQEKKAALVESLLSNSTNKFKLDQSTLSGLFAPIDV
jgi:SNF2 family DNA or RNA helicase